MKFRQDIKRFVPLGIIAVLLILTFLLVKPFIIPIAGGLILAYALFPVYKKIIQFAKNRYLAVTILLILTIVVIAIPIWLLSPILINQSFVIFKAMQSIDFTGLATRFFPSASAEFTGQMAVTASSIVSKINSAVLNTFANLFLNFITLMVNFLIVCFILAYTLIEHEKIAKIARAVSPFAESKEKILVKQFKDITNSIVYGQALIGIVQGLCAGLGFWIFGVPNAALFALVAVVFSMIPMIGPWIVWIPAAIYVFMTKSALVGILFLAYNILLVSTIDNVLRAYIVSRKLKMSSILIIFGMIGGMFLFGIVGLILGPLILAYLITVWEIYKNDEVNSLIFEKVEDKK